MDGDPALSVPNGTTNSIHTRPHDLPVAVHVDKRPKVTPNVTNGTACTPGVVAATENGSVGLTKPTGPVPPRTDIVVAAAPAAGTTANVSLHSYEHLSDEIALHVACRMGDVQKLQELLRKGVDIESVNKHGWRPLHGAAANGRLQCLVALLSAKAQLAATDAYGWQPLHDACARGETECVRELLRAGADKTVLDIAGMSPIALARANRHDDCVKLLSGDADAKPSAKGVPKTKKTPGPRKKAPSAPGNATTQAPSKSRSRKRPASPTEPPAAEQHGEPTS